MTFQSETKSDTLIGVLSLQGAFKEHQNSLEAVGFKTRQIRRPAELDGIDGIVLPGGESTAMGLIGTQDGMWVALQSFVHSGRPVWGTCAGMILLAERCVGTSAVIENGQSLIGGMDVLVCRNYFGSQISSFEMSTPPPPGSGDDSNPYPGVFIRAPAILSVGENVEVLGKVVATPSRHAAVVLNELERKIAAGENIIRLEVVDGLNRCEGAALDYAYVKKGQQSVTATHEVKEEKKETVVAEQPRIELPGASDGTNAREVICAARTNNTLITSFHPELTSDYRWHSYFGQMVVSNKQAS